MHITMYVRSGLEEIYAVVSVRNLGAVASSSGEDWVEHSGRGYTQTCTHGFVLSAAI